MKSCRCDPVLGHKLFFIFSPPPPPPASPPECEKLQKEWWRPGIVSNPSPAPRPIKNKNKRLGVRWKLANLDADPAHAGRGRLSRPHGKETGLRGPARLPQPPVPNTEQVGFREATSVLRNGVVKIPAPGPPLSPPPSPPPPPNNESPG